LLVLAEAAPSQNSLSFRGCSSCCDKRRNKMNGTTTTAPGRRTRQSSYFASSSGLLLKRPKITVQQLVKQMRAKDKINPNSGGSGAGGGTASSDHGKNKNVGAPGPSYTTSVTSWRHERGSQRFIPHWLQNVSEGTKLPLAITVFTALCATWEIHSQVLGDHQSIGIPWTSSGCIVVLNMWQLGSVERLASQAVFYLIGTLCAIVVALLYVLLLLYGLPRRIVTVADPMPEDVEGLVDPHANPQIFHSAVHFLPEKA
ncbi:unnamed protein product, partial [Amoebophrya sp. A120]